MSSLKSKIETLLFVSGKPLAIRKLAQLVNEEKDLVESALEDLIGEYNGKRGISVVKNGGEYHMASSPENGFLARLFYKDEQTGDLTRPALETLTIIAYRGPLTKPELEEIRGINCGLILRNLLMRGLIKRELDASLGLEKYSATGELLEFLGIFDLKELPDYDKLSQDLFLSAQQES